MRHVMAAAAGAIALVATPALAAGPMGAAVGNTIRVDYLGGEVVTIKMKRDGTADVATPGGRFRANWLADARHFCVIQIEPRAEPGRAERCERNLFGNRRVGDSWTQTDSYGQAATVRIIRGQ